MSLRPVWSNSEFQGLKQGYVESSRLKKVPDIQAAKSEISSDSHVQNKWLSLIIGTDVWRRRF